jgi:hypothetical protein
MYGKPSSERDIFAIGDTAGVKSGGGEARTENDEVTSNCFGTLTPFVSSAPQLCCNPQTFPGYTDQSDTVHDGLILLETCLTIPAIIHHL